MPNIITTGTPLNPVGAKLFGQDASGNVGIVEGKKCISSMVPSGDVTGSLDTSALRTSLLSLAGSGGNLILNDGDYYFNATIDFGVGFESSLGKLGVTVSGSTEGATRLRMVTDGIPLFQKTSGLGLNFKRLYLYGPGPSNPESVGIAWLNAGGGALWEECWFENWGVGSRFIDATLMQFDACHWRGNGRNVELGYNCDIFNFNSCRLDYASDTSVYIGYRDSGHLSGVLAISNVFFNGSRISNNNIAIDIADYGARNIVFHSYFESNVKIAWVGDAAQPIGPKSIVFDNSVFTMVNQTNCQIECRNSIQESSFVINSCSCDADDSPGGWLSLGLNSRLTWVDNTLLALTKHVIWNGGSYLLDKKQSFEIENGKVGVYDGSVLGANIPLDLRMTNGTGKTWASFTRRNASTGGVLGIADAKVTDVDGKFVCFSGPILIATPTAALPTAAATYRGIMAYQQGTSGVQDTIKCCMKSAADTYSWITVAGG